MFGMGTLGHQRWGFQHSCRSCRRIEGTEVDASLFLFFQYNRTVWMGLVWVFWWFLDRRAKQRLHRVLLRHLQETSLPAVQVIHLGLQLRFRKHFFVRRLRFRFFFGFGACSLNVEGFFYSLIWGGISTTRKWQRRAAYARAITCGGFRNNNTLFFCFSIYVK